MDTFHILNNKSLSVTSSRKRILEVLLESKVALSEKELREALGYMYNRATVYRTLKVFTENNITHPVVAENNVTRYVIRKEPKNHLHFRCLECNTVLCLTDIQFDSYVLPEGFTEEDASFVITGLCSQCNNGQ